MSIPHRYGTTKLLTDDWRESYVSIPHRYGTTTTTVDGFDATDSTCQSLIGTVQQPILRRLYDIYYHIL